MKWISMLIGAMLIIQARTISLIELLPQYQTNQTIQTMGIISPTLPLAIITY